MISVKQWQKIHKTLIFDQFFCEMGKKLLPNSGFYPKNVAKNGAFYVVTKPKKLKSCQNRGVAKIEGFQNRGSTVYLRNTNILT